MIDAGHLIPPIQERADEAATNGLASVLLAGGMFTVLWIGSHLVRRLLNRKGWCKSHRNVKALMVLFGGIGIAVAVFVLGPSTPELSESAEHRSNTSQSLAVATIAIGISALIAAVMPRRQRTGAPGWASRWEAWTRSRTPLSDTPIVLYLRPFATEDRLFHWDNLDRCTADEYLLKAVEASLGRFVALGSPTDLLPPAGATRTYHDDDSWRDEFIRLARQAQCIIGVAACSPNITWELGILKQSGLHKKLFLVTPPTSHYRRGLLEWLAGRLYGRFNEPWNGVALALRSAGFVAGDDPGPGTVMSFTTTGRAIPLERNVRTPLEYVAAIEHHLTPASDKGQIGEAELDSPRRRTT
jgi:hypothetical protein